MQGSSDVEGPEVEPGAGAPLTPLNAALFQDLSVELSARMGGVEMSVAAFLELRSGALVTLDARLSDPVDLLLGDVVVARGEIVAVCDHFGLRIVEVAKVS